jgi:hypothetical protein
VGEHADATNGGTLSTWAAPDSSAANHGPAARFERALGFKGEKRPPSPYEHERKRARAKRQRKARKRQRR